MPKQFILAAPNKVRGDQLAHELNEDPRNSISGMTTDHIGLSQPVTLFIDDGIVPDGEEAVVQDWITNSHEPDNLFFDEDRERDQVVQARGNLASLFAGLRQLDPEDAAYAAYGRSFAAKNGATAGEISLIVDRPSAASYITGTSFWTSMTVAERGRWALDKDAEIFLLQIIIGLLG